MASYCDIIAIRSFAGLTDRNYDYAETVMQQFVKYSGKPVVAMETATVHPLQAFADLITIEEHKTVARPKVVLTWAPHCRALPQAVPNSFAEWMRAADVDLVVTHPEGYELDPRFVGDARVEYDQRKAFEGADFIYAKNWSCPGVTNPADYSDSRTRLSTTWAEISRLAASGMTSELGPSMTSSVTIRPRRTGRQCMNFPLLVHDMCSVSTVHAMSFEVILP